MASDKERCLDACCQVETETHAVDRICVPLECELLLASFGIPHLHRPVLAAANDPLPVRAETHPGDIMSFESEV